MKQVVFFATGSGTNFQSVIDAIQSGKIDAQISGLITNKQHIGAVERAKNYDIPTKILAPSAFQKKANYEKQLLNTLQEWQPDLIVLAGYMLKIPETIIRSYQGKIINIHPSLLPKFGGKGFYGIKVHEAVLNSNETESGCSVHIVTEEYDQGPVIAQRTVPIHKSDTPAALANRVLEQEHLLLPEVVNKCLTNPNQ